MCEKVKIPQIKMNLLTLMLFQTGITVYVYNNNNNNNNNTNNKEFVTFI